MAIGVRVGVAVGVNVGPAVGVSADPLGGFSGNVFAGGGDSNMTGIGIGDAADPAFAVATPNPAVLYNTHYANGVGPPPSFVDYPAANTLGPLSLYAASSGQSMGIELTLGSTVLAGGIAAPAVSKFAVSGSTLANEWLPSSTYPAAGAGNLYNLWLAKLRTLGGTVKAVVMSLGTNDAATVPTANAFGANLATFCSQLRTDLGNATLPIVWIKTNAATSPGDHPGLATVRAAQVTYAGTDTNFVLIDNDDLSLIGDLLHYTADAYLTLGQRCAIGALEKLGVARRVPATAPDVMQFGPTAKGSGNLSIVAPGDVRNGDLLMLGIAAGVTSTAIATPAGWTLVGSIARSVFGGSSFCQMNLFTRAATTAELNANNGHAAPAAYTAADTENIGQMWVVRGPNLNPTVDVKQNTTPNSFTTGPQTITGVTTTAANEMVIALWAGFCGSAGSNVLTHGSLANVAKVFDGAHLLPDTNFQLMALSRGSLAAAGASGAWSVTSSANVLGNAIVAGIKP